MIMKLFTFLVRKKQGKHYSNDLTKVAIPGDIFLHRGSRKNILYSGIQMFTSSPYNHAEIYIDNGWAIGAGTFGSGYDDLCQKEGIDVFRLVDESDIIKDDIVKHAKAMIGNAYSYEQGFLFPFLSKRRIKKLSKDNMHNCSEMVALCYKYSGVDIVDIKTNSEAIIAPADIGRSKKLKYVGTFNKGVYFSNDESMKNKYSEEIQGKKDAFISRIIIYLFKRWSKKDDFYKKMFNENIYLNMKS